MDAFKDGSTRKFEAIAETLLRPSLLTRDQDGRFDTGIWLQFADAGLFGVGRSKRSLDLKHLAAVFYRLAERSLDVPLVCTFAAQSVVARELLLQFGSEEQIARYLPEIESGKLIAAVCNSEPGAATDLRKIASECNVGADGVASLKFHKPCVTNGDGSLFFVSAWKKSGLGKPSISVFIVEKSEVESRNVTADLSGFRTGLTGSVQGDIANFPAAERELRKNAFEVFRHCFNIERLFIGVIVAGALRGLENEALAILQTSIASVDEQWRQDKLIRVSSARIQLDALIETILQKDLERCSAELGVLKMFVNEQAFDAAMAFLELSGHRSLSKTHVAQKLVRDLTALRFFGGTTELQKISLFAQLIAGARASHVEKAG